MSRRGFFVVSIVVVAAPDGSFLDFAFRNCSVRGGWLLEDGSLDIGPVFNSSRPLGFTNFQPCFDK